MSTTVLAGNSSAVFPLLQSSVPAPWPRINYKPKEPRRGKKLGPDTTTALRLLGQVTKSACLARMVFGEEIFNWMLHSDLASCHPRL